MTIDLELPDDSAVVCVICGEPVSEVRLRAFERAKLDYVIYQDKWEVRDVATCSGKCGVLRRQKNAREKAQARRETLPGILPRPQNFAEALRMVRERTGATMGDLAREMKVSVVEVSAVETGRQEPDREFLAKYTFALWHAAEGTMNR